MAKYLSLRFCINCNKRGDRIKCGFITTESGDIQCKKHLILKNIKEESKSIFVIK